MSFGQAIKHVFKNYANFRGRASRSEFWWFYLFMTIVSGALYVISMIGIATSPDPQRWGPLAQVGIILTIVWFLATILPVSAVWFRRLHDSNKSGWWYILPIVSGFFGFTLFALSALQNQVLFAAGAVLGLVSGLAGILLLIFALLPGTPGPNRYGEGPASA